MEKNLVATQKASYILLKKYVPLLEIYVHDNTNHFFRIFRYIGLYKNLFLLIYYII